MLGARLLFKDLVTETINGPSVDMGQGPIALSIVATLDDVTTLDGEFQHSPDSVTWYTLAAFTQITGVTTEFIAVETARFSNIRFIVDGFTGNDIFLEVFAESLSE